MTQTRGKLEARISEAVIQFEREFMGRGPLEAKTYLIDDMVIVRLKGVLTPAEHQLAKTVPESDGRALIKKMRETLIEKERLLYQMRLGATGSCLVVVMGQSDRNRISGLQLLHGNHQRRSRRSLTRTSLGRGSARSPCGV
ncbi:MAG TPA: DUF2294 domain-containing protein [Candidatus Ozemobacteraceae bacterium]|nr:DUF2294 domain-containing protein [Candidatus Ozemobacteraceae bacterium]